ncbi:hypothetical protein MPQ_1178 [Methylovorus sp. MP688]|nr:hypothetical protein MPQ_1178 [Methylovorus sp. MP688]
MNWNHDHIDILSAFVGQARIGAIWIFHYHATSLTMENNPSSSMD